MLAFFSEHSWIIGLLILAGTVSFVGLLIMIESIMTMILRRS